MHSICGFGALRSHENRSPCTASGFEFFSTTAEFNFPLSFVFTSTCKTRLAAYTRVTLLMVENGWGTLGFKGTSYGSVGLPSRGCV